MIAEARFWGRLNSDELGDIRKEVWVGDSAKSNARVNGISSMKIFIEFDECIEMKVDESSGKVEV